MIQVGFYLDRGTYPLLWRSTLGAMPAVGDRLRVSDVETRDRMIADHGTAVFTVSAFEHVVAAGGGEPHRAEIYLTPGAPA